MTEELKAKIMGAAQLTRDRMGYIFPTAVVTIDSPELQREIDQGGWGTHPLGNTVILRLPMPFYPLGTGMWPSYPPEDQVKSDISALLDRKK